MRPAYRQGDVTTRLPREGARPRCFWQRDTATAELDVQYGPDGPVAAPLIGEHLQLGRPILGTVGFLMNQYRPDDLLERVVAATADFHELSTSRRSPSGRTPRPPCNCSSTPTTRSRSGSSPNNSSADHHPPSDCAVGIVKRGRRDLEQA
jgi:hypothetical protein